ncbi:MAG TPA: ornithine cyclodeaminase family protein [Blastocatellia bacterium]|nr:ornithine cyclodeaminase family protein [Blastocatellia bacterium]
MKPPETLLLKRGDVTALLGLDECITAVEQAFKLYAEGQTLPSGVLGVHAQDGGFHIKAAGLKLARTYFATKVNGNFFWNTERYGMPNIQGIIMLCDGDNGYPLSLMDSIGITILRTGAATAVAAKYLARDDARVATICGCGNQGRIQLKALMKVRALELVYAFDLDHARAERFACELSDELSIEAQPVCELTPAARKSDICVTCTPSKQFFLKRDDVAPGTFIAAVGADDERKQELDPRLFAGHKIVVDILEQCATIGDLHHALDQGLFTREDVHAELGEVVAGIKPGRASRDEIIIFDSTGTALQDAAAAALVYEKAKEAGSHFALNFAE